MLVLCDSSNGDNDFPLTVVANADVAVRRAAGIIIQTINTNNAGNKPTKIGFATGSTMIPLYAELVSEYKRGHVSFKNVVGANLDEYAVASGHHESYRTYMQEHLFNHIDINPDNTHLPNGGNTDLDAACAEYEATLQKIGQLDIQLVGIGVDGHIGFNEPPASKDSRVHVEKLDPSTVLVNRPPSQYAITMGIANIMSAKSIIFIATGESKANIMRKLMRSEADYPDMPASFLKSHTNVIAICDWDAVSRIDMAREEVNKMVRRGALDRFSEDFTWGKRVLIMSPHPDDDVIGVGGLMARHSEDCEISVVYQTTGRNAVGESSLRHHMAFIESIFKKPKISTKLVSMGIRRAEAKIAAGICGITDIEFMEMPFYRRKRREKKPPYIEDNDVVAMIKVIAEKRPDIMIINGDADPNLTHVYCRTAILRALARIQGPADVVDAAINAGINAGIDTTTNTPQYNLDIARLEVNEPFADDESGDGEGDGGDGGDNVVGDANGDADGVNDNGIENTEDTQSTEKERISLYEYCSAWGEFSLSDVSVIIPLTEEQLRTKEEAVLAHESQNPPVAHNGNTTPFHERAVDRPRDALALLKKMGFDYPSHIAGVELLVQNESLI